MRTSFFAGAATALLLSACSRRQEGPPVLPTYGEDFGDHPIASALYRDLRARNVAPVALDRGCAAVGYAPDGTPTAQVAGAGDLKIVPCEVDEYILEKGSVFPDLARQITDGEIPWALDHPMIPETIALLDRILAEKGLRPDSDEYRERKAFGLFLLAAVPFRGWEERLDLSSPAVRARNEQFKAALRALARRAEDLGLGDLNLHLEAKGGLGTLSDSSVENTAAQAVKEGAGDCTEMSKILHAVFRQAGFDAFFVLVNPWKSEHPGVRELIQVNPNYFHVVIGLKRGGKTVLYDPGLPAYDPLHRQAVPLTLRQYLSLDFVNRGIARASEGKIEEAMQAFDRAGRLDPSNDTVPVNRSASFLRQREFNQALREIERAVSMNPAKADYYYFRGLVRVQRKEPRDALADFDLAIRKNPDHPLFYYDRGVTRGNTGDLKAAVEDLTAHVRLSPAPDVERIRKYLDFIFQLNWTHPQSPRSTWRETIESELGVSLSEVEVAASLARILWDAKTGTHEAGSFQGLARIEAQAVLRMKASKKLSEPARQFVDMLFDRLPKPLREEDAFAAKRKSLR